MNMIDNTKMSDEEIIEKIRSSDTDLYAIIIERYQPKLICYANNIVKDQDQAVDIIQETFIKAFVNLNSFNSKKKFSSWIYRIAHNEAMDTIKKYNKEVKLPDDFDFESDEDSEKDFEKKEIREKIEKCLKEIPILYSEPLSLFYIDEKSYEEISDVLRIPMGTVAIRISRAKKLIKKICQKI